MYHAYSKDHVWSEGYYFFTFANKQACAQFKQSVAMATIGSFLSEPVWGDADPKRERYTPEAAVTWGYTIYAFVAHTGSKGTMQGNWVENPVPGGNGRYYLRIHVPGLDEHAPYWNRLVSRYK